MGVYYGDEVNPCVTRRGRPCQQFTSHWIHNVKCQRWFQAPSVLGAVCIWLARYDFLL